MPRCLTHYGLILGMTLTLFACGFQLRGSDANRTAIPQEWKSMHLVSGNPNGEFSRNVTALFAANGVEWTDRADAKFSLVLNPERFSQRSLSLNSEARVAEYELTMSSQFSVIDSSNQEVIPTTSVSVIKQMENDPRNVVGKEGEVQLIQNEMRYELAEQIMRRIRFHAVRSQAQPSTP
ncbi:MAG: LPS assembly lipoprotein LptE [Halioglobus sp.]